MTARIPNTTSFMILTTAGGICPPWLIFANTSGMSTSMKSSPPIPQTSQSHEKTSDSALAQRRARMDPIPIVMNHAARNA